MGEFNENESFDLAAYDPNWPDIFERESELVAAALGDDLVEIQHIGSTSIPGLRAKPIIDLLAAVESFVLIADYERLLAPLDYHHHTHPDEDERIFFWKGIPRTHHLHIVEYASWEHLRHLVFRDYLRNHSEMAQWYEQVKRELWIAFKGNRPAYTKGKTAFIKTIMARAVEEIIDPSLRRLVDEASRQEQSES